MDNDQFGASPWKFWGSPNIIVDSNGYIVAQKNVNPPSIEIDDAIRIGNILINALASLEALESIIALGDHSNEAGEVDVAYIEAIEIISRARSGNLNPDDLIG